MPTELPKSTKKGDKYSAEKANKGKKLSIYQIAGLVMREMKVTWLVQPKEFAIHTGSVYERSDDNIWKIKDAILRYNPDASKGEVEEVLERIRVSTRHEMTDFDAGSDRLNLLNCSINVRTGLQLPPDPDYLSFRQVRLTYDPTAECPKILAFLEEAMPDPVKQNLLLDMTALTLWFKANFKKAVGLYGPPDSAKSAYLHLVERVLGNPPGVIKINCSHVSFQDGEIDKFAEETMVDKMANICADINRTDLLTTGHFKRRVGGDGSSVQSKFGGRYETLIPAMEWYSCNDLPESRDMTDAFMIRWCLIQFENVIPKERQNKHLVDDFSNEELSGFLNILLERLKKIVEKGMIDNMPTIEGTRKAWLANSDPTNQFLHKTGIVRSKDDSIEVKVLWSAYVNWCVTHNQPIESVVKFNAKIEAYGGVKSQRWVDDMVTYKIQGELATRPEKVEKWFWMGLASSTAPDGDEEE